MRHFITYALTLLAVVFTLFSFGQQKEELGTAKPLTRILFLFDASGSMGEHWQSDTKYRIAVNVLTGILDSLKGCENLQIALRVYGPKRDTLDDCQASYLMVPFGEGGGNAMTTILRGLKPEGSTPIAYSLEQAIRDFTPCTDCRNIIVLITDGKEACTGDPCGVSLQLQQKGVFLRPFIVGIGENLRTHFDCMGHYVDATKESEYKRALNIIVASALKEATVQVVLLDERGRPTETNLHVTLYNRITGRANYSFMHTLDDAGKPDTLTIDPLIPYDVVVQTIPPVRKERVEVEPGRHTIISVDVPQGYLAFASADNRVYPCIIRRSGSGEAIHVQSSDRTERYLAGTYDVTALTTPRMNVAGVVISPDAGVRIPIPVAGIATLIYPSPIVGELYMEQDDQLIWVCRLQGDLPREQLFLQPGTYRVIYRSLSAKSQKNSQHWQFALTSDEAITLELLPYYE